MFFSIQKTTYERFFKVPEEMVHSRDHSQSPKVKVAAMQGQQIPYGLEHSPVWQYPMYYGSDHNHPVIAIMTQRKLPLHTSKLAI